MYATGWVEAPQEVAAVMQQWAAGGAVDFSDKAPHVMQSSQGGDDSPVFLWDAERAVLGRLLDAWNQNPVGSCVGFGGTRAEQDCLLNEIAGGEAESWPGAELAPEIGYAGSRVQIGKNRIRGDGSVGAWFAEFAKLYGCGVRGVYGNLDLTRYDPNLCRRLASGQGLPAEVLEAVKAHPVTDAARVQTKEEIWAALGARKPVFTCSIRGFAMRLDSEGFCQQTGRWGHCMASRARFVHPRRGRSIVKGNSWGPYLGRDFVDVEYLDETGHVQKFPLPPGHFCTSWSDEGAMASEGDSFALAGLSGWAAVNYAP